MASINSDYVPINFTPDIIDEDTIIDFVNTLDQQNFNNLLEYLADQYHNNQSLIDDNIYDQIVDIYEAKYQPFTMVGAEPQGEKEDLPYYLGSLRKLKEEKELDTWIRSHPGPYVLEDKIDGLTLLLDHSVDEQGIISTKLLTRGGGYRGTNVSHLLGYLNLPKLTQPMIIRGEIVMNKGIFERFGAGFKNPRNLVSGVVNSKKQFKPELARRLSFYAYRIINTEMAPGEQAEYLQELGYLVPNPTDVDTINKDFLTKYYLSRLQDAPYEMDGIVIYQDISKEYPVGEAPRHVVAFKTNTETVETIVTHVTWKASKERLLK